MVTPSPRPPIGEPVLDDFCKRLIIRGISRGYTRTKIAAMIGCAVSTIMRTAERDPQFFADLAQAEAAFLNGSIDTLYHSACQEKNWRAAAWVAERLDPDRFGRTPPRSRTIPQMLELIGKLLTRICDQLPEEQVHLVVEAGRALVQELVEAEVPINLELLFGGLGVLPGAPDQPVEPTSIRAAREAAARAAQASAPQPPPAAEPAPSSEAASTGEAASPAEPLPTASDPPASEPVAEAPATSAPEASGAPAPPPENPAPPSPNTGQTWSSRESGEGPVQRIDPD
jgi:hypothetical protein